MTCRHLGGVMLALLAGAASAVAQPEPAATLGRPVATLGRPRPASGAAAPEPVRLAAYQPEPSSAEQVLGPSYEAAPFNPPDYAPPRAPSTSSPSEAFLAGRPARRADDRYLHQTYFGERLREQLDDWLQPGHGRECDVRKWFQSDHAFDYFASPVSMPFFLEDPRALTEVRPIFLFQSIPNDAESFYGGHAEFYGTQIRLALTERFSFNLTKLGFVNFTPGADSGEEGGFGFAEVHFGPKFTFVRNQDRCFVAAAGLNFQIPSGPERVYQDTGALSIVPYLTTAKNFLENRFGSLNFMHTIGYSFSGDGERSDFLYNSFHLDWDVANRHKIYPLLEFHYVQYTKSGGARDLDVEGRDLANIGDTSSGGRANFNLAAGLRYKLSEQAQVGIAAEFPLNSRRDLQAFRLTLDFILRY